MTGFILTQDQVIFEFTLTLLEDSDFYKTNYYTGGLMQFRKNKGCDFLKSKFTIVGKLIKNFLLNFLKK